MGQGRRELLNVNVTRYRVEENFSMMSRAELVGIRDKAKEDLSTPCSEVRSEGQ